MAIVRFLAFLVLLLPLLNGCDEEAPHPPPDVDVVVRTMKVTLDDLVYPGAVRGRYESRLSFQVSGRLCRRLVDVGDTVRAGQVLFEIDPKDIEESVHIAAAQMESAKLRMDLAQIDFSRYEKLWKDGAAAKSQYDQFKTAYDSAVETWRQTTRPSTSRALMAWRIPA